MATSNEDEYDHIFKILLVGDSMVGKSSLVLRYARNEFKVDFMTTIGVDFLSRTEMYDNVKVMISHFLQEFARIVENLVSSGETR